MHIYDFLLYYVKLKEVHVCDAEKLLRKLLPSGDESLESHGS